MRFAFIIKQCNIEILMKSVASADSAKNVSTLNFYLMIKNKKKIITKKSLGEKYALLLYRRNVM